MKATQRQIAALTAGKPVPISEAELQRLVLDLAHKCGWRVASFRPARVLRNGVEKYETPVGADGKGFPDLVMVRDRVIWAELKADGGKLRPDQEVWRDRLLAAGEEWYCWRPCDWHDIEEVLK